MNKFYFQKLFIAFFILSCASLFAQNARKMRADGSFIPAGSDEQPESITYKTMNVVVCPPVGGITCTLNGPSSSSYLGAPAGCNAGSFAGSNPWDGGSITGFVSWAFSAPIKGVTLKAGSVNTNDFATHSFSGGTGGTITISGLVCLSSLAGMTIGAFTGLCCGDVSWNINSTGTFTFINLANTGGQSGWIAECPSFITVLPIELLSFDGVCSNSRQIDLKWKTITESNSNYFTIERSADAIDWQMLGSVKAAGTSNSTLEYNFTDNNPLSGINYYRLKQTDLSGNSEYSPITTVDNCNVSEDVLLYPNPASTSIIVKNDSHISGTIEVYNLLGLKLASYILSDENKIDVRGFDNGSYFFKVINGNDIKTHRIQINNQ